MPDRKTLWVTGASGFLGRHVARRFAEAGWSVAGIGRHPWDSGEFRQWGMAAWLQADIEPGSLARLADIAVLPQCVFHAAGGSSVGSSFVDPLIDFRNSVVTTAALLDFLRHHASGATVLLPSSAAVYGVTPPGPIAEDTPLRPVSPYGRHKQMAEALCAEAAECYGLTAIAIRYFSLYGPGLRKQLLWDLVRKVQNGGPVVLFGTGDETRDMLHVADAAELAFCCAESTKESTFSVVNGGSGTGARVRDIAALLLAHMQGPVDIRFSGESRAGDPKHYQADTARSGKLGFAARHDLDGGLAEYAAWARASRNRDIGQDRCEQC